MATQSTVYANKKHGITPWLMWGAGALFYAFEFLLQVSPNAMGEELLRDFNISANKLATFGAIYFWAYAVVQLPGGILLDRFGPKRLLGCAALICGLGCILFAQSSVYSLTLFARFFIGLGSAFAVIGCLKLATNWFPITRFALLIGLTVAIGKTGAIIGEGPLAELVEIYNWRHVMMCLAFVGIALSMMFFFLIKDKPDAPDEAMASRGELADKPLPQIWPSLKKILKNKQMWLVAGYGGLMFAPSIAIASLWGTPFLIQKLGVTKPIASTISSFILLGWAIGSPLCGYISDSIQKRKPTMIFGSAGALLTILVFIYAPVNGFTCSILLFFFGVLSSGFLSAFSIAREISPQDYNASAIGFMNTMNTLGIPILIELIGFVLELSWDGVTKGAVPIYTLPDYQFALSLLPLFIIMALLLTYFVRETHCKSIAS